MGIFLLDSPVATPSSALYKRSDEGHTPFVLFQSMGVWCLSSSVGKLTGIYLVEDASHNVHLLGGKKRWVFNSESGRTDVNLDIKCISPLQSFKQTYQFEMCLPNLNRKVVKDLTEFQIGLKRGIASELGVVVAAVLLRKPTPFATSARTHHLMVSHHRLMGGGTATASKGSAGIKFQVLVSCPGIVAVRCFKKLQHLENPTENIAEFMHFLMAINKHAAPGLCCINQIQVRDVSRQKE